MEAGGAEETAMSTVRVKGGYGGRIDVDAGQRLEIVNVSGKQVCDFWSFSRANVREHLSPGHTRSVLRRIRIGPGDRLYSVLRTPMWQIVEDTCGTNDFLMPQCDPLRYSMDFGVEDHRSCRHNLAEVMADHDIPYEYLPEPFNFFQPTPVLADGSIGGGTSPSKAGDRVVLEALMDLTAAASACPQDQSPLNDHHLTDIDLVVGSGGCGE